MNRRSFLGALCCLPLAPPATAPTTIAVDAEIGISIRVIKACEESTFKAGDVLVFAGSYETSPRRLNPPR
jgi:hypothetical protein